MGLTKTFIITIAIVITEAAKEDDCDACFHKDDCYIMNIYGLQQQQTWLTKYACQNPFYDCSTSKFVPDGAQNFVCCTNIILEIENNLRKLMQITDNFEMNDEPFNNPQGNDDIKSKVHRIYKRSNNDVYNSKTVKPDQTHINNKALPRESYVSAVPSFGNKRNVGKQCLTTVFPPHPETECCGWEATDTGRITGPVNSPANNVLPKRWMTDNIIFPSMLDNLWQRSEFARNRVRRDILGNTTNITFDSRIAGGQATEFEQFPWTVLLKITFSYGDRKAPFNCGGSLISSKYVLTAAHCLQDKNGGTIVSVEVYLDSLVYSKQSFPKDCKNVLGIGEKCIENIIAYGENVILHSEYNSKSLTNDIALIRLRATAPYTNYIRPICLPSINLDSRENSNLPLIVAGWGRNGPYRSDIKQSTVVNLVPNGECKKYYPSLTTKQLCAVGHTGEDTCKGDSGGPLMTVYGGKYFVVGIVSGKRADYPCGSSVPSLYTNVYHYLDWILSNIKK